MENKAQIPDLARLQQLAEAAKASGCELREILGDTSAMYTPQGSLIEFCEVATPAVVLNLIAENKRLARFEAAYMVWTEKTEWVQSTARAREFGMHRADILRARIAALEAK
jgi:hypothetical protein